MYPISKHIVVKTINSMEYDTSMQGMMLRFKKIVYDMIKYTYLPDLDS